jgi:Conjugative transposon protein TcpC
MSRRASVTVTTRPLWQLKLVREMPRYLLYAMAIWGVLASARYAIVPPRPVIAPAPHVQPSDRAAEGFASLFARRYLSWNAGDPQAYQQGLAPFLGNGIDASAGTQLPNKGTQQVLWSEVVQQRELRAGEHIYTIAAQTDSAGLLYLTVGVMRNPQGELALTGYPAFVGAPASVAATDLVSHFHDVANSELATVVQRALRNYLSLSSSDLAADLTTDAQVSLPGLALQLQSVQQLKWLPEGSSVFAVVQASDERGTQYTLDYELDVSQRNGRWEISAIQMNPNST